MILATYQFIDNDSKINKDCFSNLKQYLKPNPDDCCNLRASSIEGESHINLPIPEKKKKEPSDKEEKPPYEIEEKMKPLYDKPHTKISNSFKDLKMVKTVTYFKYLLGEDVIFTIESTKSKLKIVFNTQLGTLNDDRLEDVSSKGKHGIGDYRFSTDKEKDFDFIIETIKTIIDNKIK